MTDQAQDQHAAEQAQIGASMNDAVAREIGNLHLARLEMQVRSQAMVEKFDREIAEVRGALESAKADLTDAYEQIEALTSTNA